MIFLEEQPTFGMAAIAGLIVIAIGVALALHGLTEAGKKKDEEYWKDWNKKHDDYEVYDGYEEFSWKKNVKN